MKGFVITKENDPVAEQLANDCILSGQENGILIEKFFGHYNDLTDIMNKEKLFLNPQALKKIRPGVIGCFLSHFSLWKKCVELNEPILICEYDAVIINSIDDVLLNNFTDYLNLDYARHLYLKDIDVYESNLFPNHSPVTVKSLELNDSGTGYKFMNRNHIKGAFGYVITPSGARKVISSTLKDGIVPADVALNLLYLNVSYTEPSLVRLNPIMLQNRLKLSHTINS